MLLGVRYVFFVLFGIYRRVWRFATPRDLVAIAAATALSAPIAIAIVAKTQSLAGFPLEIFVVDALLCTMLVAGVAAGAAGGSRPARGLRGAGRASEC